MTIGTYGFRETYRLIAANPRPEIRLLVERRRVESKRDSLRIAHPTVNGPQLSV